MLKKQTRLQLKTLLTIGTILLILLGLWIGFGPTNNALLYYKVTNELKEIKARNQKLAAENSSLKQKIRRLKEDPAFLEEIARKQEGLIKKNEVLYDFRPKK